MTVQEAVDFLESLYRYNNICEGTTQKKAWQTLRDAQQIPNRSTFQDIVEGWMYVEGFGTGECNRVGASRRLVELLNAKVNNTADALLKEYDAIYDIGITNPIRYPDVLKEWLEKVRSYNKTRTNP